jgi:hypothetical protein
MVAHSEGHATNLYVGTMGSEGAVEWQSRAIDEVLIAAGLELIALPMNEEALRDLAVLNQSAFKARITVRPTDLPAVASTLNAASMICHVQTGIIEAAFSLGEDVDSREFASIRHEVTSILGGRGHLIWTAVPARLKAELDVWGPARPGHAIMRKIKQAMDPGSLFSPGRFLGRI